MSPRPGLAAIAEMVPQGARVLDVGCGERGRTRPMQPDAWGPNLLAEGAIFLLKPR